MPHMCITQHDRRQLLSVSAWCHMLMVISSAVPEVPQEVAFSKRVVTSVFVTWSPPPGKVEGYKVRRMPCCICPVPSNTGHSGERQKWSLAFIFQTCQTKIKYATYHVWIHTHLLVTRQPLFGFSYRLFKDVWPLQSPGQEE